MKKTFTYFLGGALFALFLLMPSTASATITAKWDWKNSIPDGIHSVSIQNTTGTVASNVAGVTMFVDATSGKLANNGDNAQFVSGTILRVPVVSTYDVVTFTPHPYDYAGVTIGAADYSDTSGTERTYSPSDAEVQQGYVQITSKGGYLYSVQVKLKYKPVSFIVANWDWVHTNPSSLSSVNLEQYSGDPIDVDSDVDGISLKFVYGKLANNGTSAQFNAGTILRMPITSTNDFVTVSANNNGFTSYTIGSNTYTTYTNTYKATATDVENGYVEIVSNCSYLNYIQLEKHGAVTIGSTGWATFSNSFATDFTDITVNAKIVTGVSGSALTMTDVTGTAAANTGLLLNADEGTYAIPLTTTGTDYSSTNKLVAGTGAAVNYNSGAGYNYVLAKNGGVAVFQRIVEGTYGSVTVAKGKAYLALASNPGAHELTLDFSGGGSTDIQLTKDMGQSADGVYYNLAGQRVAQPTKGLYIVNGKKVIVK